MQPTASAPRDNGRTTAPFARGPWPYPMGLRTGDLTPTPLGCIQACYARAETGAQRYAYLACQTFFKVSIDRDQEPLAPPPLYLSHRSPLLHAHRAHRALCAPCVDLGDAHAVDGARQDHVQCCSGGGFKDGLHAYLCIYVPHDDRGRQGYRCYRTARLTSSKPTSAKRGCTLSQ